MCHLKIYIFRYCVVNDEVASTSSQILEQVEVNQEVVLPGISELNDSAPDKEPEDQTQFSPKIGLLYLLSHRLMDRVME